jgi:hypothetical protein
MAMRAAIDLQTYAAKLIAARECRMSLFGRVVVLLARTDAFTLPTLQALAAHSSAAPTIATNAVGSSRIMRIVKRNSRHPCAAKALYFSRSDV